MKYVFDEGVGLDRLVFLLMFTTIYVSSETLIRQM